MIDKVLEIINKYIPDKTSQAQAEIELRKLSIEELKIKGDYLEKINKCIPFVLPAFLLVLLLMFTMTFLSDFIFSVLGKEAPLIHIDDRLIEFCKWFVGFLLEKRLLIVLQEARINEKNVIKTRNSE